MSDERRPERSGATQLGARDEWAAVDGGGDQWRWAPCPTNVGPSGAVQHCVRIHSQVDALPASVARWRIQE